MDARAEELAAALEEHRPRLVRVAYAILGSRGEAEDTFAPALVNGRLGLVALAPAEDGSGVRRRLVMSLTVDGGLVSRVDIVMAPDKLGG